jgi:flagellar protein FlbD
LIRLTRLNGNPLALNSDLIKLVENAPDTVITLINGEKMIVRETTEDVIRQIIDFRRQVLAGLPSAGTGLQAGALQAGSECAGRGADHPSNSSHLSEGRGRG